MSISQIYHVYILENTFGKFYIGHTDNLQRRLAQHNESEKKSHLGKFTHKHGPWQLVWTEEFPSRAEAMLREREIKSWKSKVMIQRKLTNAVESRHRRD